MSDSESEAVRRGEIWIEKYRPESLDGVVGHPEITDRLKSYVERDDLPNLLFSGPAGTGKCVTGETPVLTNRGVERIGDVVGDTDGFGDPDPGLEVATFDDDGSVRFVEPSRTYSKKADELVSVRTRDGIEMEVTSEHPLLVIDHDGLEWKEAGQLAPGDRIARPLSTPTPTPESDARIDWPSAVDPKRIFVDLSESFVEEHDVPIEENHVGAKKVVLKRLRDGDTVDEIAADTDIRRKTVRSYEREFRDVNLDRSVTTCSLSYLTDLDVDRDELLNAVESIQYVTHANNNRSRSITPPSELTPDLASFLGMAISEARIDGGRVQFYNTDDALLERFENTAERVFDVETNRDETKSVPYVEIGSRTLTHYLESCFDVFAGTTTGDGIGSRLVRADEASRAAFLRAVFDAEGYISRNGIIELTQKKERLITLLGYLLASFGIRSRRERETKAVTNGSGIEREYHTLRISGSDDLRRFEEAIGFTLEEKADRLADATARDSNPNDDTIPVQNSVARLREGLYLSSSDLLTETPNPETPGRENYLDDLERVRDAALERLEAAQDTQERIANLRGELGAIAKTPAEWAGAREALQPLERRRAVGDATGIRTDYLLEYADGRHTPTASRTDTLLAELREDEPRGEVEVVQSELKDVIESLNVPYAHLAEDTRYLGTDFINLLENDDHDLGSLPRFLTLAERTTERAAEMLSGDVLSDLRSIERVVDADLHYDVVEGVERIEEDSHVYDLTVPGSHNYVAGTLPTVMHNTASSVAIARELYGEDWNEYFLELNASDERGIDVVRDRIKNFARSSFGGAGYRIIFLDEADALTDQAQSALRRTMEQFSHNTRFILSCVTPDTDVLLPGERETTMREFVDGFEDGTKKHVTNIENTTAPVKRDLALATVTLPPELIGTEVLKITTTAGREIKVTEDHMLHTPDGWRQAGSLARDDELVVYPHLEETSAEEDETEFIDRPGLRKFLHQSELDDGKETVDEADNFETLATLEKKRVLERTRELIEKAERGTGLTGREHDLYRHIEDNEGSSRQQLQEVMGLSRQRMNQLLSSIEEKGYVSRHTKGKTHFFETTRRTPHRLRNKMRVKERIETEFDISVSYSTINRAGETKARGRVKRVMEELDEKGLLDVSYTETSTVGALARICGFMLGDGHLVQNDKRLHFAGNEAALSNVKDDLDTIGYDTHSKIRSKEIVSEIEGRTISGTSTSFTLDSTALSHLLQFLGVPSGDKTITSVSVPKFVKDGTTYVKREFLRALFGCDADAPRCDRMNFDPVMLRQNKALRMDESMRSYYDELSELFAEFDVETYVDVRDRGEVRESDDTPVRTYHLVIRPTNQNLYRFFSRVGYAYEPDKSRRARLASEYLRQKQHLIERWEQKSKEVLASIEAGASVSETAAETGVTNECMPFDDWIESFQYDGEFVLNEIEQIERVNEPVVMDVTCKDDHNFITNGLVSHNCNYSSQIIDPIQSRCAVFRFSGIPDEAVAERIREIADEEGIEYTGDGIDALVYAAAGDMRKAINGLQAAAVMGETVDEDAVYTITSTARPEEIEAMVESALAGEFTTARSTLDTLLTENGLAGGDIIDQLHRSAWDFDLDDEAAVRLMDRVGEADYRIAEGANERVQLEALLASIALENGA